MSGSNGKNGNGKVNGKPGPKLKITEAQRDQILAALSVGGSLGDAAALIGVDEKTLYNIRRRDPEFSRWVKTAIRAGKMKLVERVANASSWQAAAWLLERRWGAEFGRKDYVKSDVKHSGRIENEHSIAANTIRDPEAVRLAEALNERMASHAGGNGQSNN